MFAHDGICLFGGHRGKHASTLPPGWVMWAKQNIAGFTTAYEAALGARPVEKQEPKTPGRRYILKPYHKPTPHTDVIRKS